jgi:hypothetical protein
MEASYDEFRDRIAESIGRDDDITTTTTRSVLPRWPHWFTKLQVIGDYETGRAVPNAQIMGKIERALDVMLPRPVKTAAEKGGVVVGAKKKVHAA